MSEWLSPLVHEYSWLFMFIRFKNIHGAILHSSYQCKTGIIHEYCRIYTMNILELFMFMKAVRETKIGVN